MEIFFVVALLVAVFWWRQNRNAQRIVHLRSIQLAEATGFPAAAIAREIVSRRMTPGDWAMEHGLDPLTFRERGQGRSERTFPNQVQEEQLPIPDWGEIEDALESGEQRLATCAGWTVTLNGAVSNPVFLFLTDAALYANVTPQTALPPRSTHRWENDQIVDCGVALQPDTGTRLMIAHADARESGQPQFFAVDLRPAAVGQQFAEQVCRWAGFPGAQDYGLGAVESRNVPRGARRRSSSRLPVTRRRD